MLHKRLCKEGFSSSAYHVRRLMAQLGLVATQRITYKSQLNTKANTVML